MTLMFIKYYFLKKNHTVQKILSNNLFDTMILMLLDHHDYARKFEGNTTMSFNVKDSKLLKKYNQIWKKVKKLLKINFNSEPIHDDNDEYIKTKIMIYGGSVNTNFQDKKMTK